MDKKTLINIIINQNGIAIRNVTKEQYDLYNIGDIVPIYEDIKAEIINKNYYPDYDGCKTTVTYKILATIEIKKYSYKRSVDY